jgi:hypothetical protein
MANGDVDITEGSGLKVGTYSFSEDAVTRHAQRIAVNDENGAYPSYSASATFTAAAAAYLAADAIEGAKQFSFSAPSGSRIIITSASLMIENATVEATAWRLYLFNVTPPSALADNAAFTLASGDRASFLGFVDLGTAVDLVDTQWVEVHGINKQIKLSGTSVFAYLVPLTGLTPTASARNVTLHAVLA